MTDARTSTTAAPQTSEARSARSVFLQALGKTKLYWGLVTLIVFGALTSPLSSKGNNIFLSLGNLTDILRQVSVTGIVAVGMTLVIFIAGIDLSVGSVMALGTVICAMLLTQAGWTAASVFSIPATGVVLFIAVIALIYFVQVQMRKSKGDEKPSVSKLPAALVAAGLSLAVMVWMMGQVEGKFGVMAVLIAVPCVGIVMGSLNGALIVYGRLQPFIVTLAMMVGALGLARVIAGQDTAVYPVYTGSNAVQEFDILRSLLWGVVPVPGLFFLAVLAVFFVLTRFTTFGSYLLAIGGNAEAARLAGINVKRNTIVTYAIAGGLSALAGILYVAQFRQGKPDAGLGLELDAIAAVVIGGTSLMGGRGAILGTFVGVLIFGFLSNILQLNNIDSNTQLILKGVIIIAAVLLQEGRIEEFLSAAKRKMRGEK
ncbi:ABC transporter permease [Thalassovita mediterranea]|uniref:Ribose transport system permease protein RbsC n=1 Tax=Thalassovita mediterranea TaxID=340021 RepID=A0A0P1HA00_9RHOB|nr:ABC transporter permease [Thalassovita mediterranea]CUH83741.1 Ribose transport system permease protein RbsC [Thalassovita mediterranea]SIS28553.1 monosaccharide ABC transporter membrane protein, CUT2 family [Thalassovita mediterranea]